MPVRLHLIALIGLEKEALIASAALGAGVAGDAGLSVRWQTPV
jgi:hypothetical protein